MADGSLLDMLEGDKDWAALPRCANDSDWRLVAQKLCIPVWRYDLAVRIRDSAVPSKGD